MGGKKQEEEQTVVVNPAIVLVVELLIVLKVSTDEDFQEGIRLGVTGSQLLDGVESDQVVELEACREVDGGLDKAESKLTGLGVVGFLWGDSLEGLEEELVKLTITMSVWLYVGIVTIGVMIERSRANMDIPVILRLLRDTRNREI